MTREKKTKQEKIDRKKYLATNKKYKKEIKKIFKHYGPWEFCYIGQLLDKMISHWIEYYSLGYNVQALEIKDTPEFGHPERPTRLQIALKMRELLDAWFNFDICKYGDDYETAKSDEIKAKRALYDYIFEYIEDMWD